MGPAGIIRLIGRDGDLLFSQPHSRPSSNSGVGHQPILEAVRSGAAKGFALVPSEEDGRCYPSAWHTLADLPLVVTVSIAEADALSSWHTERMKVGASAGGTAVLVAVAGLWITHSNRAHGGTDTEG